MRAKVNPGIPTTEGVLRRAKNVFVSSEDRQQNSENGDRLRCEVLERANYKQLFVAAEAGGVHSDRVIKNADPNQSRHAEPPRRRVRHAVKRKSQPQNSGQKNQNEEQSAECNVLG